MGGLSIGGLASGLDTKSIIDQLMQIEQQPLVQLQQKKAALSSTNSSFQAINTRISSLTSAASDLTLDLNVRSKSATSTDTSVLKATAGAGAAAGSYQVRVAQLATATSVKAAGAIGSAVTDSSLALNKLPTASAITSGNFTLSWTAGGATQSTTVSVDSSADQLQDVLDRISAASGGAVTAALGVGADANRIVLTAGAGTTSIVAGSSGDTSNFLTATNLRTQSLQTSAASTDALVGLAGASAVQAFAIGSGTFTMKVTNGGVTSSYGIAVNANDTVQDVLDRVSATTGGAVTASVGAGADAGRILVTGGAGTTSVTLGGSSDDSNFLSAMKLQGQNLATTMRSTSGVGVSQAGGALDGSGSLGNPLATALTFDGSGNGSFTINGVSLAYSTSDSLASVLARINSSTAGVTATYNQIEDRVTLTARKTGSGAITLADGAGSNFLAATGLLAGTVTNGQNAKLGIVGIKGFTAATDPASNPDTLIESASNTFSNVLPGVTFNAVKASSTLQNVAISQDTGTTVSKVKAFVDQFNAIVDAVKSATAKDGTNPFDSDLRGIMDRLREYLVKPVSGLSGSGPTTLVSLGVSTDTDRIHLAFDDTKFTQALTDNPDRVADLFQKTTTSGGKTTPVGIFAQLKSYLSSVGSATGVFKTRDSSNNAQLRRLDDQISAMQKRMTDRRTQMQNQFAAMEKAVSQLKSQQSAFLSQMGSAG